MHTEMACNLLEAEQLVFHSKTHKTI
jgi:hypothetical protein